MKTELSKVSKNVSDAIDGIGQSGRIIGIQFETADSRLLDVREGDFDEHVSMQPAAIAYFGNMKKTAMRNLENMKRAYERWQKKVYSQAKQALESAGNKKPTIADIDAFVLMNNEATVEKYEKDIETLQEQSDTMDVWYESWRQKSYSLREHGELVADEKRTTGSIMGNNPMQTRRTDPDENFYEKRETEEADVKRIIRKAKT